MFRLRGRRGGYEQTGRLGPSRCRRAGVGSGLGLATLATGCGGDRGTDDISTEAVSSYRGGDTQDGIGILGLVRGLSTGPIGTIRASCCMWTASCTWSTSGEARPRSSTIWTKGFRSCTIFSSRTYISTTSVAWRIPGRGYQTRDVNAAGVESPLASSGHLRDPLGRSRSRMV